MREGDGKRKRGKRLKSLSKFINYRKERGGRRKGGREEGGRDEGGREGGRKEES